MGILKGIYYRFKLKTVFFNYSIDYVLDAYINRLLDMSIMKIDSSSWSHTEVTFSDGSTYRFWNANKYYAWLNSGHFSFHESTYSYNSGRPTARTMYRLRRAIEQFNPTEG